MYSYEWNLRTRGYRLTQETGKFIASEIRPVFKEELSVIGFDKYFVYPHDTNEPIMWAKHNKYIYKGEVVAQLEKTQYGKTLNPTFFVPEKTELTPVDIKAMVKDKTNTRIMDALVANTLKRIKEMYDRSLKSCDIAYIGFSGGKDSVVLLDLCHQVLPLSVPVIFSDTDMELPDTYKMWDEIQKRYEGRPFIKVKADKSALENWEAFGPPSRTIRWCCSVHKSVPPILKMREMLQKPNIKAMAFLGVRSDESLRRSEYEDVGDAVKNASQISAHPILHWSAHELWLYIFNEHLPINLAYRKGLSRVGCILCPEASEKYAWFVNVNYPQLISSFNKVIINTINKNHSTSQIHNEYLSNAGWQARKSGQILNNSIVPPSEIIKGNVVTWEISNKNTDNVLQWLNTLGRISKIDDNIHILYRNPRNKEKHSVILSIIPNGTTNKVSCVFDSIFEIRTFSKYVRNAFYKSLACIGCRACEIECITGALSFSSNGSIHIDSTRCINCLKCHSIDYGCWRLKSMIATEKNSTSLSGINKYTNFGLRSDWASIYLNEKDNFSASFSLPDKMKAAARAWFRQALLMKEKSCEPTMLLSVAERFGINSSLFWDALWMGLSNNAAIVKWVVTTLKPFTSYSPDEIFTLLGAEIKDATKKGGIAAFRDTLTKSPLGMGDNPIISLELKGKANLIVSMTRKPHEISPLVSLYGLYIMAEITERNAFTISQMMSADFSSAYVSPITAFALPVQDFKTQLSGLASKYPDFIRCSFQMGLDEVYVYSDKKTKDDVISLMLNDSI